MAHLLGIASEACCTVQGVTPDVIKTDVSMYHEDVCIPLTVQLKTLIDPTPLRDGSIPLQIERALYDRFRPADPHARAIFLLALPPIGTPWFEQEQDHIKLSQRMYWVALRGAPPLTAEKPVIHFPPTQILTPAKLREMFAKLAAYDPDGALS